MQTSPRFTLLPALDCTRLEVDPWNEGSSCRRPCIDTTRGLCAGSYHRDRSHLSTLLLSGSGDLCSISPNAVVAVCAALHDGERSMAAQPVQITTVLTENLEMMCRMCRQMSSR